MTILSFIYLLLFAKALAAQDDYKFSDDNEPYSSKRAAQLQGPYYIMPRNEREIEVDRGRFRHVEDAPELRRYGRLSDRLRKRDLGVQAKEPLGLVYSKGQLLGVLEPYNELFQLEPVSNAREGIVPLPVNDVRALSEPSEDTDDFSQNDYTRYTDDKYPMVLADFKINSRLSESKQDHARTSKVSDKSKHLLDSGSSDKNNGEGETKLQSKKGITEDKISELSSALQRIKQSDSSDTVEAIEEDLRGLLSDMGLIDSETSKFKRDATKEDENLEEGQNSIEIVKSTRDPGRNKRDEPAVTSAEEVSLASEAEMNPSDQKREATTDNVKNYQSEGDAYVRNKRHEMTTDNSNLKKGLETSGELTVSGNKSPLASSDNSLKNTEKRKDSETTDYEKLLEKNIQQRIEAIKEEVKREIASLQAKTAEDPQRKKRDVPSTLQEQEYGKLSPLAHPDEPLVGHIRTKRNLKSDHLRTKRGVYDDYSVDDDPMEEDDDPKTRERSEKEGTDRIKFDSISNDTITLWNIVGNSTDHETLATSTNSSQPLSQIINSSTENPTAPKSNTSERRQVVLNNEIHTQQKPAEALIDEPRVAHVRRRRNLKPDYLRTKRYVYDDSLVDDDAMEEDDEPETQEGSEKEEYIIATDRSEFGFINNETSTPSNTVANSTDHKIFSTSTNSFQRLSETVSSSIEEAHSENPTAPTLEQSRKHRQLALDNVNHTRKKRTEGLVDEPFVAHIRIKRNLRKKRDIYDDYLVDDDAMEEDGESETQEGSEEEEYIIATDRNEFGLITNKTSTLSNTVGNSTDHEILSTLATSTNSFQPLSQTVSSSIEEAHSESPTAPTLEQSRKRRQVVSDNVIHTRKKRAEALVPDGNVAYLPYRAEDDEIDDEGDEFEDDGFDDRSANLHKREANRYSPRDFLEYEDPYQPARKYVSNLNSDVYDHGPSFMHDPSLYIRRKRHNFDHLAALHGGGAMLHHLAAVRERSRQLENDERRKRNFKHSVQPAEDNKQEQQRIADLSDTDLFGALPQSYEGELSRFKRVKRNVADVGKGG